MQAWKFDLFSRGGEGEWKEVPEMIEPLYSTVNNKAEWRSWLVLTSWEDTPQSAGGAVSRTVKEIPFTVLLEAI